MTVSTALLESVLQQLAGSLIGADERVQRIVTSELTFRRLLDLTRRLYPRRKGADEQYAQLKALTQRASDLYDRRNVITHSVWAAGGDGFAATRIKLTTRGAAALKTEFERISPGQVGGIALQMQELAWEIQDFWIKHLHLGSGRRDDG